VAAADRRLERCAVIREAGPLGIDVHLLALHRPSCLCSPPHAQSVWNICNIPSLAQIVARKKNRKMGV
jgi:hypothetical protein